MPRYVTARELIIASNAMTGENVPVPPPKKKHGNEESAMQCALIKWWAVACKTYGIPERLLFSIPNGGRRDPLAMVFLKREGLRPGVPDLFLSVPRGHWHGLYVEMKTATGRVRDEQHEFIESVRVNNYAAFVCRSADDAKAIIERYLTNPSQLHSAQRQSSGHRRLETNQL